jgi:HK97 family phage major capsid protein
MKTVKELLDAARVAVLENKLDEAEALKNQAVALKSIEDLTPPPPPEPEVKRMPFGNPEGDQPKDEAPAHVKAWYVKKYGDIASGAEQINRELYGAAYEQVAWQKSVSFNRFLRTGFQDEFASLVLLTPEQIVNAAANGLTVGEIKSTMIEANDELGGFLVPEELNSRVIARLPGMTVVRSMANVQTTSKDNLTYIKATGGDSRYIGAVRVTWVDESPSAGAAETNATFGQVKIPVHVAMATIPASKNLLEDSAVNLPLHLEDLAANGLAQDEDAQFLIGFGNGRPQGILNGTAAQATGSNGYHDQDISRVPSGTASALTTAGLVAVPYAIAAQYRNNGTWVFNKATAKAISQLADTNGNLQFRDRNNQLASGQPRNLDGYPFKESEAMPGIAANTLPIIFGDFKGYTIADRIGMSLMRYDDSSTAETNSVKFVLRRRVGGQVTEGWRFAVQHVAAS